MNRVLAPWTIRDRAFMWGQRTYVMGILNVTPDSFSDGGQFNTLDTAIAQAEAMMAAGADILDIGGQSTRPQAETVPLQEELDRVIPVIQAVRQRFNIPISVDTTRAIVAKEAVKAGADIVNEISGATYDPEMLPTVAALRVPIIVMHIRGTPKTMQQLTQYDDVVQEVLEFLQQRRDAAIAAGVEAHHIVIDPGIGFAKTYDQNLTLLHHLRDFHPLHCPILVGPSRKSFIGHILNQPDPQRRVWGTAAACCAAIAAHCDIVRVHDVQAMVETCRVADVIWRLNSHQ